MARIAGINLPPTKKVEIALNYIYGIGPKITRDILAVTKIDPSIRVKDLTDEQVNKLREIVEKKYIVEGDLRRKITSNIKRLREIGCYRGTRHAKNLPTKGQRTKTNSRTVRGNVRRTMGSGKAKSAEKT